MQATLEIERRSRGREDTGLASTFQLDAVRRDFDFRAMVVATHDGEMLLGSMDEPIGRPLALAVGAVGTNADHEDAILVNLRDEHLGGDRKTDLHVMQFELEGHTTYLGILAKRDQPLGDAMERTVTGLRRIFETT